MHTPMQNSCMPMHGQFIQRSEVCAHFNKSNIAFTLVFIEGNLQMYTMLHFHALHLRSHLKRNTSLPFFHCYRPNSRISDPEYQEANQSRHAVAVHTCKHMTLRNMTCIVVPATRRNKMAVGALVHTHFSSQVYT